MRRVMSLWLPSWPIDRLLRQTGAAPAEARPFVTALTAGSRRLVAAASSAAAACGIQPGLPLADAQAWVPGLAVHDADPAGDAAALARLAEWCGRYSPSTRPDGADGILIDVTGCAHLEGGEALLAAGILGRLAAFGFAGRTAIADTAGAAWAVARFGGDACAVVAPGTARQALAALPVAALRLPAETASGLDRLGLRRIGALYPMPRAALTQRFGAALVGRLDAALGMAGEPLAPLRPVPARRARLAFAEPVATQEDLARALVCLAEELCRGLAAEGSGARRLHLACYRVDGTVAQAAIGTARPSRDAGHLTRLFAERLGAVDPGFGVEAMVLAAALAEPLAAAQLALPRLALSHISLSAPLERRGQGEVGLSRSGRVLRSEHPPHPKFKDGEGFAGDPAALAALVDRLGSRLGLANLCRPIPCESHLPERAVAIRPALEAACAAAGWPAGLVRPVRLFARPLPVEAVAPVPDDPPVLFRWRRLLHRVRRADGPERIAGEWWRSPEGSPSDLLRDYYRVEDEEGRRFWLFRAGFDSSAAPARWFLHGLFA